MSTAAASHAAANLVPGFLARTKWQAPSADDAEEAPAAAPLAAGEAAAPAASIKYVHFRPLWEAFPSCGPLELAERVGGSVGRLLLEADAATCACAALSHALILCGVALPAAPPALSDAEGRQYLTTPRGVLEYLRDAMGREHRCKDMAAAVNRSGIIVYLDAEGGACAVDLWRGTAPADSATVSGSDQWTRCKGGAVLFEMAAPGPHLHGRERASFPGGTKSLQAPLQRM